ncbi:Aste57867_1243 [Aphanomyces stellatus]|uniref:Aste57867_1243 protein n=1 Tax=Aphanomyces stellatus TaxID=120398 RepID=A0A485K5S7_9STRA|nr:hypothetical protein As57867_001242 [Aphanomyces stellatus]VFT78462.1 Aste57867_1243 [Aphanomyces stellatus]
MFFWRAATATASTQTDAVVVMSKPRPSSSCHTMDETLVSLPPEVLARVIECLSHVDVHRLEAVNSRFRVQMQGYNCWKYEVMRRVVLDKTQWVRVASDPATSYLGSHQEPSHCVWKRLACLADLSGSSKYGYQDLIQDVLKFSSADRDSESAGNTLKPSKCWHEIQRFHDDLTLPYNLQELPTFSMFRLLTRRQSSLGETIQMLCGCSSGNSCYWSSAASTSQAATESIFYRLRGHCIVRAVSVLPYRVFWHPGAPTYGPCQVSFSFFANVQSVESPHEEPFYISPVYDVVNDMVEQTFELPMCVLLQDGYLSVNLLGRHQAQTFDIPAWMQPDPDNNVPKYYCCLSQVSAKGILMHETVDMTP